MRQRVRLNAVRNIGFSATVSARALNVASFNSLRGFDHHDGTKPQRIGTSLRLRSLSVIVSIVVVGQTLYLARLRGGMILHSSTVEVATIAELSLRDSQQLH